MNFVNLAVEPNNSIVDWYCRNCRLVVYHCVDHKTVNGRVCTGGALKILQIPPDELENLSNELERIFSFYSAAGNP